VRGGWKNETAPPYAAVVVQKGAKKYPSRPVALYGSISGLNHDLRGHGEGLNFLETCPQKNFLEDNIRLIKRRQENGRVRTSFLANVISNQIS
jgi:hypothetical protein